MGKAALRRRTERALRLLLPLLAVSAVALAFPGRAWAHAELISSDPRVGATLGTAPGIVTLIFSEQIESSLSRVTVTAPDGQRFTGSGAGTQMSVALSTNAPGDYAVGWTAVSADDGHTTSGSFGFSVVTSGSAGSTSGEPPGALGFAAAVARALEIVALFLAVGLITMRTLAARSPGIDWVKLERAARWPLLVAFACGLLSVLGDARLASSSATGAWGYLTHGEPGIARLTLLWAEALAVGAETAGVASAAGVFVAGAAAALGAAGHGASLKPEWFGISLYAGHLWSASLWAGGILSLLVLRPPLGWRGEDGRALLDRFSPIALGAFGVSVATGATQAWKYLGGLHELFATSYGKWLVVKIVVIAAMTPLSILAWRRQDVRGRVEAALAAFAILVASLMAAYPPPALAIARAFQTQSSLAGQAFLRQGELTLGDHAGQVLVGLSIAPARPGTGTAYLYLLPLYQSKTPIPASMTVDGKNAALQLCGYGCRRASVTLSGGDTIRVSVAGSAGGTATFVLPQLPASDGTALLARADKVMHSLSAYRLNEFLGTGATTVHTKYAYRAPDSVEIDILSGPGTGSQTFLIGSTRWTRSSPSSHWVVQPTVPVPVPSYIWDYFKPWVDPRVVGTMVLGGTPTTIVAFFGSSGGTPVWFRLWIDPSGLVRRAEMRAQGHFMDHTYTDPNGAFTVAPPPGAPPPLPSSPSP